ncbi:hypothetical protein TcWFU_008856 [Taenia crassiceps]|uniref:Uncharacterized protein n=1 Tax=Taenia crassiceps TaxID=6207 RepID=A0ABR4Q2B1_9CEST
MDADLSVRRNIKLAAIDPYTPGQTIVISIGTHYQPRTGVKFEYLGTRSDFVRVTIPPNKRGMRKPTFETTFFVDSRDLLIKLHNPKTAPPDSPKPWNSVANLTSNVREYMIEKLHPLPEHSFTVRGFITPNIGSAMADPLAFEVVHRDLSAPQDYSTVLRHSGGRPYQGAPIEAEETDAEEDEKIVAMRQMSASTQLSRSGSLLRLSRNRPQQSAPTILTPPGAILKSWQTQRLRSSSPSCADCLSRAIRLCLGDRKSQRRCLALVEEKDEADLP